MTETLDPAPSTADPRLVAVRRWLLVVAGVLATLPTLVTVLGAQLLSPVPGTCDAWPGCTLSARQQWLWDVQSGVGVGLAVAAFLVVPAYLAPVLFLRASVRRVAALTSLWLLVPVTVGFGFLFVAVWGTECSPGAWFCFSGPADAALIGSPGLVTGTAATLLALGMRRRSRLARGTVTAVVTGLVGLVAATAASYVGAMVVDQLLA